LVGSSSESHSEDDEEPSLPLLDTYELTTEPTKTSEQSGLGFFYRIFCCMSGKEDGEENCV
jgi:hypothetical protein